MKLTVFGGTGPTGRQLLRLALTDGHQVTAVARDPAALADLSAEASSLAASAAVPGAQAGGPTLVVRAGDVLDAATLAGTCEGADAVLSALGTRTTNAETSVYSTGARHIMDAMRASGVTRLVLLTAAPVAPAAERSPFERLLVDRVLHRFFGSGYRDMARLEELLRAERELAWTVLRPPRLLDRPATGSYRSAVNSRLRGGWSISRADLARAMLDALADPATVRAAVNVAN